MDRITNTELHKRAYVYYQIDKVGLFINPHKLAVLRKDVLTDRKIKIDRLSQLWNCHVYIGKDNDPGTGDRLNLNASSGNNTVLKKLQKLGFNVPKVRYKDKDTGYTEYKDSANELALRRCLSEEKDPGHIEALTLVIDVRELTTLYTRYINAKLYNNIFYSNYNICGAVTGRRSCRKNAFGFGGNGQNFPKHYEMGERFIECITARPGHIFFIVDQMQAEDWPVSALAENFHALEQLKTGFDRHTDLASFIFGIPKNSRTKEEWKKSIERYLGKKCRHAHNYGMRGQMMSDSLAKEGKFISKETCDGMLEKVSQYDPQVDAVFHSYIKNQLFNTKMLSTPFGRERIFLGLKQGDSNYKILNEAYSWIPQSVVGDNTGFAATHLYCDDNITPVNESHDSIIVEPEDKYEDIEQVFRADERAFDREITFHNGIKVKIPIEAEIGYDLKNTIKLKNYTIQDLQAAYQEIQKRQKGNEQNAAQVKENVAAQLS